VTVQNQILFIFSLSFFFGGIRFLLLDDLDFSIIKKERIIEKIESFTIPEHISSPMVVDLAFSKYHFDSGTAIFIDSRDPEDFKNGHIKNAINIPYDYYEDYEEVIDDLDDTNIYIIYCSGGECSLSIDLADYLFSEKLFEKVLVFEGGWPEWKGAGYP